MRLIKTFLAVMFTVTTISVAVASKTGKALASSSRDTVSISTTIENINDSISGKYHSILTNDTINSGESQEADFQDYIDTLFMAVDTFFWDNKMINSGHFESKDMKDTVLLILQDSLKNIRYVHPFKNYVTSGFGQRRYIFHYGLDIKLQKGDSVVSALDGVVRVTKFDRRGFGYCVVVRHPNGLETIYGHLSKVLVLPNQKLKAGDLVGLGGSTGRSTGAHLHFETRYFGEPFDPNCFIDFDKYQLKSNTLMLSKANFEYLIDIRKAKFARIRKGDTLSRIARRYHTTIGTLCKLNSISPRTLLRVGRSIRYQ